MQASTAPSVLIIIVTWNKKQFVLDLLHSLNLLNYPTQALHIVVVDNASTDGTATALKADYPQITLLQNTENLGGTGGFNTGLAWAFQHSDDYHYIWLLDNDVLVHQAALTTLVTLLENHSDIGVVGSTMMQLDYPWRVNEMGAFFDFRGQLILNRHLETIPAWQGQSATSLAHQPLNLSRYLMHCTDYMDVDYVAAASLLVRMEVAKAVGLWRDYFIHFDDVEWCLRIARQGWRVVVSAQSVIWHLSAVAKVPTWVLYYDNRNVLDVLQMYGHHARQISRAKRYILKKAVYYHLIGKTDLADLHLQALTDFIAQRFGKKTIDLTAVYRPNAQLAAWLADESIQRILIAWPVNLMATGIQEILVVWQLKRPQLRIELMTPPNGLRIYQLPQGRFLPRLPANRMLRWWRYWRLRGHYDLVIQSEYQKLIGLSWLDAKIVFLNDESFAVYPPPRWQAVWQAGWRWFFCLFSCRYLNVSKSHGT